MANRTFHCPRLIGRFIVPVAPQRDLFRVAFGACGWIQCDIVVNQGIGKKIVIDGFADLSTPHLIFLSTYVEGIWKIKFNHNNNNSNLSTDRFSLISYRTFRSCTIVIVECFMLHHGRALHYNLKQPGIQKILLDFAGQRSSFHSVPRPDDDLLSESGYDPCISLSRSFFA